MIYVIFWCDSALDLIINYPGETVNVEELDVYPHKLTATPAETPMCQNFNDPSPKKTFKQFKEYAD